MSLELPDYSDLLVFWRDENVLDGIQRVTKKSLLAGAAALNRRRGGW